MTMDSFRDQFVASKGGPIVFEGKEVHLSVRLPVRRGDQVRVLFVHAARHPIQGLRLRAEGAAMEAVGHEGKQFVIWDDTAPSETLVNIVKAKNGAQLVMMNIWKDESEGTTMQGMGFAGMWMERRGEDDMVLRCSDGRGAPTFDDLVVRVTHVKAHEGS